jgi:hypothetical protein
MSFETTVLNKVAPILSEGDRAEFTFGTLFVQCSDEIGEAVFKKLHADFNGKVLVSRTPAEFAYDFIS